MNTSEKLDKATGLATAVSKLGTTTIVSLVFGILFGLSIWSNDARQRDDIAEQKAANAKFIEAVTISNAEDARLNAAVEERNRMLKESNALLLRIATALERTGGLEE